MKTHTYFSCDVGQNGILYSFKMALKALTMGLPIGLCEGQQTHPAKTTQGMRYNAFQYKVSVT